MDDSGSAWLEEIPAPFEIKRKGSLPGQEWLKGFR